MVEACPWGDLLGVAPRWSADDQEADPTAHATTADVTWADSRRAVWARLYDDPLFEIRLSTLEESPAPSARALSVLRGRIAALADDPKVRAQLSDESAVAALHEAAKILLAEREFDAALPSLAATKANDLIARSVVSTYIRLREEEADGTAVSAADRDALEQAATDFLGGVALGVGSRARDIAWATAQRAAHPILRRYHDSVLDRATPAAGDVLAYQARGGPLRRFIAERVREVRGPVVLLGHSLGGIACFETLVAEPLPQVASIVTVGSQVPYLYSLDALATHRLGAALPEHFGARWVNLHDPVDLLAFPAEPQFGSRVSDVRVDTREPFPRAHGAYWTTRQVYDVLAAVVKDGER